MKILMLGPSEYNSTDGVIIQGIKNILNYCIGDYSYDYLFLDDFSDMAIPSRIIKTHYDYFIVCGTPWLWDGFYNTAKYNNFMKVKKECPWDKGVLFGIGSAFCLSDKDRILRLPSDKEPIEDFVEGMFVIVRDLVASSLLSHHGIDHTFLPCPAYFCYDSADTQEEKIDNVIIYYSPKHGISNVCCGEDFVNAFNQKYINFLNENPDSHIYCVLPEEVKECELVLNQTPTILTDVNHTLSVMKRASNVISGRVHCSVPAIRQGASVEFLPVDTRSSVIYSVNQKDLIKNYYRYLDQYKELIVN